MLRQDPGGSGAAAPGVTVWKWPRGCSCRASGLVDEENKTPRHCSAAGATEPILERGSGLTAARNCPGFGKEAAPIPRLFNRVLSRRDEFPEWAEWDGLRGTPWWDERMEGMLPLLAFKKPWKKWEMSLLSHGIQDGAPGGPEGVTSAVKVTRKPMAPSLQANPCSQSKTRLL